MFTLFNKNWIKVIIWLNLIFSTYTFAQIKAFPGAEGFGQFSVGGRGGKIIEVTNLNDSGAGSFREACQFSGPRIIIFRVGGAIKILKDIKIKNPFITIAAQTAPGDGVYIRGASIRILTHDVIIRGLRLRVGDETDGPAYDNRDGFGMQHPDIPPYNIIIDHCSVSWALDENFATWRAVNNITIQWCIISEGLFNSPNPEKPHSMGFLVNEGADQISIHHNLFAHNMGRNPRLSFNKNIEVINNLVYNWMYYGLDVEGSIVNIIGNYYKPGKDSGERKGITVRDNPGNLVFIKDNIGPGQLAGPDDDWSVVKGSEEYHADFPVAAQSNITIDPSNMVYNLVLNNVGAIVPALDPVDKRIVESVINSTGSMIDSQYEVGGWPEFRSGLPPRDSDHDGMPDNWETDHGLDPNDPNDGNIIQDQFGYTNVERYINDLFPNLFREGPVYPSNIKIKN